MEAVVMCGGRGKRLGPLGNVVNKNLLPVRGKPVIQHVVETLSFIGASRILLLAGHLSNQLVKFFQAPIIDVEVVVLPDKAGTTTTGGALSAVLSQLPEEFLYAHGNICLSAEARAAFLAACASEPTASVIAVSTATHAPTHPHVDVDIDGYITRVAPRLPEREICSVGLSRLRKDALSSVSSAGPVEYDLTVQALSGRRVRAANIGADWVHVENISDF
jgi:NDP-sugar pyrophosphorylase family protein